MKKHLLVVVIAFSAVQHIGAMDYVRSANDYVRRVFFNEHVIRIDKKNDEVYTRLKDQTRIDSSKVDTLISKWRTKNNIAMPSVFDDQAAMDDAWKQQEAKVAEQRRDDWAFSQFDKNYQELKEPVLDSEGKILYRDYLREVIQTHYKNDLEILQAELAHAEQEIATYPRAIDGKNRLCAAKKRELLEEEIKMFIKDENENAFYRSRREGFKMEQRMATE